MVNLLTFRLKDSYYAVNIENVKWIVTIEKIYPVSMMADYVLGEIRYGDHINFLVCLEKILGLGSCDSLEDKSAIIISIQEKEFAVMVDEIIYIKEIQNFEYAHDKVSFMSEGDKVVEVLKGEFFDSFVDVPAIRPDFNKEKHKLLASHQPTLTDTKEFLLFTLNDTMFAIESHLIQFVEVLEDTKKGGYRPDIEFVEGVFLVKKRLLKLLNLKKLLSLDQTPIGNNILVIQESNRYIGLNVDEIFNIETVEVFNIYAGKDEGLIKEYFLKDKSIVSILDSQKVLELTKEFGISMERLTEEKRGKSIVDLKEFLIIKVAQSNYAIAMEFVKEIYEEKDVHITRSLEHNENVEGIATVGAKSFLIIDFLKLLGFEKEQKSNMLLVLEKREEERFEFAIFINDVDDIIHVAKEDLYYLTKPDRFIKGTITLKEKIYNILNIEWLINYLRRNE